MKLTGRAVRILHWITPVLIPIVVLFAPAFLGAPRGWMAAIGLFVSPVVILGLYFPPVLTLFDREARAARRTRRFYDIAAYVLWGAAIIMALSLVDGGDAPPYGSLLSVWGVMNDDASMGVFMAGMLVAIVAWIAMIAVAIAGIVVSRRAPASPARTAV